jgi:hypothetical protein
MQFIRRERRTGLRLDLSDVGMTFPLIKKECMVFVLRDGD